MARPLRVLLVEDSVEDAAIILRELTRSGYDVVHDRVDDEASFKSALERTEWDIVLSDFSMPTFNGIAAYELLKQSAIYIPFIFVSGRIGEDRAAEAMKRGASDYILKDNLARLGPAVERELEDTEVRRQRQQMAARLRESEYQLSSIYNTVGDVIYQLAVSRQGRYQFTSVNQAFCSITGISADQVVGKWVDEVVPEPSLTLVLGKYQEAIRERKIVRWEETSIYPAGRLTGEVSIGPIFDDAGSCTHLVGAVHDITARKQAEERLRVSEERFRYLFENSIQSIVIHRNFKPLFVNQALADTFGFDSIAEVLELDSVLALFAPHLHPELRGYARARMAGESVPLHYDFEGVRKDGSRIWLENISWKVNWEGGPAIQSVYVEVTKRKEAESKLRSSEDLLKTVFDSLPIWAAVKDLDERYLLISRMALDALGMTEEELLGRTNQELQIGTAQEREHLAAMERQSMDSRQVTVDPGQKITYRDGKVRHFHAVRSPLFDASGAVRGIVIVAQDITAQRRSQELLRSVLDNAFDVIVTIDDGGIVQSFNRVGERLFGYSASEIIGQNVKLLMPEPYHGEHDGYIANYLRTGKAKVIGIGREVEGRRKDGSVFPLDLFVSEFHLDGERLFTANLRDLTERNRLEGQLRQAQKMESIGRLAGGVAHDFNNMLAVILSYADELLERFSSDKPVCDDIREIRDAGRRAAGLTRQLLAFSRRQIFRLEPLVLSEVVSGMEKFIGRLIGEDIRMEYRLAKGLPHVIADEGQIEQVLMNLVVNSRDAMPRGGRLLVETALSALDEAYAREHVEVKPGEYVQLSVTDSGTGMDEATRLHIFEPFFTTKEQGKGTGLGLATVYGVVKQLGGYIWVYSEAGKGTTFKVYLPVAADAQFAGDSAAAPAGLERAASETILLVEDDPSVRRAAERILKGAGYRVIEADNGKRALELLQELKEPVHLLLSDVVMPEMGGHDLAERAAALRPGMPVLFISGYSENAISEGGALKPGIQLLQKPFDRESLLRKVREVLDSRPPNGPV